MTVGRANNTRAGNRLNFFREFIKHPLQIGSIVPSSRFLERRITQLARIDQAETIVELGSGTGGTTLAMLHAMRADAKLLSIDINPHFHALVGRIRHPHLIAHLGDARALREILSAYQLPSPDLVISGIPFSTMPPESGREIVETIATTLAQGGRFVAYQLSKRVAELSVPVFGEPRVETELLNIPPMRVYVWEKPAVGELKAADETQAHTNAV